MTNKAWLRLSNEWKANHVNDYFLALCKEKGVDTDFPSAMKTELCKEIRKICKANYIWLQDFEESDLYVDCMPIGGHTRKSLVELKFALTQLRKKRGAS